jgi:hypothetical protein
MMLILLGLGWLITFALKVAWAPVWLVGMALLFRGACQKSPRPIIVGGIITGTGLAIVSQTGPWMVRLTGPASTGLFLICLSLGWFFIVLVSRLTAPRTEWWPLVPGSIMAITGAACWVFDGRVSTIWLVLWPLPLIGIGILMISRWN